MVTERERAERVLVFEVADSVSHSAFLHVAVRKHVTSAGTGAGFSQILLAPSQAVPCPQPKR